LAESLTILAMTDLHYLRRAGEDRPELSRVYRLALEWTVRAIREACRASAPDVIVILGDLLEDGAAPGAEADAAELAAAVQEAGLPVIVAPGNHDIEAARLLRLFSDRAGAHRIKGYLLYSFADPYAADNTCTRPRESIERFLNEPSSGPVIAIQHSPIYPSVDSTEYPYMPTNVPEIMESYRRKNVLLSLSGHFHEGGAPAQKDGTTYLTCASLVGPPFPFHLIRAQGRELRIERRQLQFGSGLELTDGHVHTHFGYCAVDVHPVPVRERIELLGLKGVACVEHAGQLYLPADDYWRRVHVEDPAAIPQARKLGRDRIGAFRSAMAAFRSPSLAVGLEVECDRDGKLNLLEEDRAGWDVLMGAVHCLPSNLSSNTPAKFAASFMTVTEQLVSQGIHVLAHPFRIFRHERIPVPAELHQSLARLLKEHGAAAELNFHYFNDPDPEFFRICGEEGTRIVMGSDAHQLREVGDLQPHLRLLRQIGVPPRSSEDADAPVIQPTGL
jgi:histidinol phosphatase-like PHP family hydrolase/Icc-related predicted phosphoesterase